MSNFESQWGRLTTAARQTPQVESVEMPLGFATRIAARAMEARSSGLLSAWSRIPLRALWLATLVMIVSAAASYLGRVGGDDEVQAMLDPVSAVLSAS